MNEHKEVLKVLKDKLGKVTTSVRYIYTICAQEATYDILCFGCARKKLQEYQEKGDNKAKIKKRPKTAPELNFHVICDTCKIPLYYVLTPEGAIFTIKSIIKDYNNTKYENYHLSQAINVLIKNNNESLDGYNEVVTNLAEKLHPNFPWKILL